MDEDPASHYVNREEVEHLWAMKVVLPQRPEPPRAPAAAHTACPTQALEHAEDYYQQLCTVPDPAASLQLTPYDARPRVLRCRRAASGVTAARRGMWRARWRPADQYRRRDLPTLPSGLSGL